MPVYVFSSACIQIDQTFTYIYMLPVSRMAVFSERNNKVLLKQFTILFDSFPAEL